MDVFSIISMFGGIAFFLFGMSFMGTSLQRLAGSKLEMYLWQLSSTPVKGLLLGVLVTAVIQSSSATTVMVVSFVNAGIMKLTQAVYIIIGANIGTTMTGWILTLSDASGTGVVGSFFSTSNLVPVFAVIGIVLYMFARRAAAKHTGGILLGLATLLTGMVAISAAVSPLKDSETFIGTLTLFSNPVLGVLTGIAVAAVLQSSSAGVGIVQALCATGMLTYGACLPLILGINIGASSPVLISMVGANKNGRRAALSYLYANIVGLLVAYILYIPAQLIFGPGFLDGVASVVGVAVMNTALRLIATAVLMPCGKPLEKLLYLSVRDEPAPDEEDESDLDKLDEGLLNYPQMAVEQCRGVSVGMCRLVRRNVTRASSLITDFDRTRCAKVQEKEQLADKFEDKLGAYLVRIRKVGLAEEQVRMITQMLGSIGDFERLSDHAVNISEAASEIYEKRIAFSDEANRELARLTAAVGEILTLSTDAYCENNVELALCVAPLEEVIDLMCKELKRRHTERLQKGDCTISLGFVFNDLLTNFERISDHCANIAFSTISRAGQENEEHVYSTKVAASELYQRKYAEYQTAYLGSLDGE